MITMWKGAVLALGIAVVGNASEVAVRPGEPLRGAANMTGNRQRVIQPKQQMNKVPGSKYEPNQLKKGQKKRDGSDSQIFEEQLREWGKIDDQIELAIDRLNVKDQKIYDGVVDEIRGIMEENKEKTSIIINSVHSKLFSLLGMEGYSRFINGEKGKHFLDSLKCGC